MATTSSAYGPFIAALGTGAIDFTTDTFFALLTTSAYTPNVDTHEFYDPDITNEITGTGYSFGGEALSGVTWVYDAASNAAILTADTVAWTGADFIARYAVIYQDTGDPETARLLGYVNFGENRSPNAAGVFSIDFTAGVFRLLLA